MKLIYATYNQYCNSIDITTFDNMILRIDCNKAAVRNYELGNRTASQDQLEKIANALKISPFALADPNFDTYISVMHSLFALEDQYGLHAYCDVSPTVFVISVLS